MREISAARASAQRFGGGDRRDSRPRPPSELFSFRNSVDPETSVHSDRPIGARKGSVMFEQALVTRYAKLHALSNMIEAWLKEKRQELLEAFDAKLNPETKKWEASNKCPDRGPFVIVLGDAEAKPNWKEEFRSYLIGTLDRSEEHTSELQSR